MLDKCTLYVSFRGPILWGHDMCVQRINLLDQSYEDTMQVTKNLMHVQRTNPIVHVGSYIYLCTVSSEGSMSSMKDQLYGTQHA